MLTSGRRLRRPHIDICWTPNQAGHSRLGLVVFKGRATGVARNQLRRRLKEIWRRGLQEHLPALDVVVRARREAYAATFEELRVELAALVEAVRAGAS